MNVASLDLCRELYELSGWYDTQNAYYNVDGKPGLYAYSDFKIGQERYDYHLLSLIAPAYDVGYMLVKLPAKQVKLRNNSQEGWGCQYDPKRASWPEYSCYGSTPEDATAKLAIELLKQGILPRKDK